MGFLAFGAAFLPAWLGPDNHMRWTWLEVPRPLRTAYRISVLIGLLFQQWIAPPARAQDPRVEYAVKAAFLLNFAKFAQWPPAVFADIQSPFEICVLGKDPFGPVLDEVVQGESIDGHSVQVRRVGTPPGAQSCQVLFVSPETKDIKTVLGSIGPGVLVVGEGDRFVRDGGSISLVIENRRVRFDINQAASEGRGVRLSSKLLSLARAVTK